MGLDMSQWRKTCSRSQRYHRPSVQNHCEVPGFFVCRLQTETKHRVSTVCFLSVASAYCQKSKMNGIPGASSSSSVAVRFDPESISEQHTLEQWRAMPSDYADNVNMLEE